MLSKCKIKHFSASVQEICLFSAESDGISGKKRNFGICSRGVVAVGTGTWGEIRSQPSHGDRYRNHSSRHTQVPDPVTMLTQ